MPILVQSFLNSATFLSTTATTSTTVLQLKNIINSSEGVNTATMQFYIVNALTSSTSLAVNANTLGSYGVTTSTTIYSSNNISSTSTWTKQQRQIQKLELAQLRRRAAGVTTATFYRVRNTYTSTQLATTYVQNTSTFDNPNIGGLIQGRPWGGIPQNSLTLWLDPSYTNSYSGTGSTWNDLTAPATNLTLVNSPTYSTNNGGYFTFNGTNQYAKTTATVVNSVAYTKSIWFYLNATLDNNLLSSDVGGHYMFFQGTNKLYSGHSNWAGFPNNYPSTGTFNNNTWYHVALTFTTSTGMVLYKNGIQDSVYTAIKTAFTGDGSLRIGSYGDPGNMLNGRVAHVMVYDRALTSEEVLAVFNATKARFGL